MKLLTLADYQYSVNEQSGIPEEIESQMILDALLFIQALAERFHLPTSVHPIAMHVFHLYTKKVPFTEVDRFMLATVCAYVGCKIEYFHIRMSDFAHFYHDNKKGGPKKRKPFEEIAHQTVEQVTDLELKVLKTLEFDFNMDTPYEYIRLFRDRLIFIENDPQTLMNLIPLEEREKFTQVCVEWYTMCKKCLAYSYKLSLCLYFPPAVIATAILLIVNHEFKSDYLLEKFGYENMLGSVIPKVDSSTSGKWYL